MRKMKNLSPHKIISELDTFGWEDSFGVDYPNLIPYWVAYMPPSNRLCYLHEIRYQVDDFKESMLDPKFDWSSWVPNVM